MPQRFGLYEDLSVIDNLNLHAELRGLEGPARQAMFEKLLTFTALKVGTFNITLVVEHPGCVTAEHPVTIEFLPTDVTAPPSAEGIEAEVKE